MNLPVGIGVPPTADVMLHAHREEMTYRWEWELTAGQLAKAVKQIADADPAASIRVIAGEGVTGVVVTSEIPESKSLCPECRADRRFGDDPCYACKVLAAKAKEEDG